MASAFTNREPTRIRSNHNGKNMWSCSGWFFLPLLSTTKLAQGPRNNRGLWAKESLSPAGAAHGIGALDKEALAWRQLQIHAPTVKACW